MEKINIEVYYTYEMGDDDYTGDYESIQLFVDGSLVKEYKDYYHDKGSDQVKGFLDGLIYLKGLGNVKITKYRQTSAD